MAEINDEPGLAVFEYARRGRLPELMEELAKGESPNSYFSYDGQTPLLAAARGGHGKVVQALINARANLEVRTEDGSDALLHSASGGSAEAVSALLVAKADIESVNEDEVTPLILAADYGHTEVCRVLIDAGADVNYSAPGWGCPLDNASNDETVKLLESRGALRNVPQKAASAAKAGEHFTYGCLDSDNAESALAQYSSQSEARGPADAPQAASAAPSGPSAAPSGPHSSPPETRLLQLARTVGAICGDCMPGSSQPAAAQGQSSSTVAEVPTAIANRATPAATAGYLKRKQIGLAPKTLLKSGLQVSPIGFGCHRIEDAGEYRNAMSVALQCGCNLIDTAPNYTDGAAETALGKVLKELFDNGTVRRDELIICSKVGNIVGSTLDRPSVKAMEGVAKVRPDVWHSLEPAWIEEEITGSLNRMGIECIDVLFLHCPEFATKAPDVDMDEVYRRIEKAFVHLEKEVAKGRIGRYGITAAFYPLRPMDAEHLNLERVLKLLPEKNHFEVIQFPLNFAEPQNLWVGHTERKGDGAAIDREKGLEAPTLIELARKHGISTFTNRPLDGLYKEMRGVLRFCSDVPINGEMQGEDLDAMEQKLTTLCKGGLGDADEGCTQEFAAKTVKCLASLDAVDSVLVGMRQVHYVAGIMRLLQRTPPLRSDDARAAMKAMHNTIEMWFCTATSEADHGTSKHWRLPVNEKGVLATAAGG